MASDTKISRSNGRKARWLQPHRERFLEGLATQGYARCSLRNYDRAIGHFCAAVERRGLGACDLDAKEVVRLRSAVLHGVKPSVRTNASFCLNCFIDHLVEAGVATLPKPPPKAPTPLDRLREDYEAYLRNQRGLSEATIYQCLAFLKRFMAFRFGEKLGDLNSITPSDIVAFLPAFVGAAARP
jgi:integrase/recombinase XerD